MCLLTVCWKIMRHFRIICHRQYFNILFNFLCILWVFLVQYLFLNIMCDAKSPYYGIHDPLCIKNYDEFFIKYDEWTKSRSSKKFDVQKFLFIAFFSSKLWIKNISSHSNNHIGALWLFRHMNKLSFCTQQCAYYLDVIAPIL